MQKPFGPHRRLRVEPLEDRSLPAASVDAVLRGGVLTVTGREAADTIVIRQPKPGVVVLDANDRRSVYVGVTRAVVDGRAGDDKVYVDTAAAAAAAAAFTPLPTAIDGGTGNDLLVGGAGRDSLDGGTGSDTVYGAAGDDVINGTAGPDRLYGNDGFDILYGGDGEDLLAGGRGNDFLNGDTGGDWVYGGEGADVLLGGAGDDYLDGESGADELYGLEDDDWLSGGAGDDQIHGGGGNDFLDGGPGSDAFTGGDGFNSYRNDFGDILKGAKAAEADSVRQGKSGTCVVLASLASVAESGVDLAARITKVGTNLYSVPLYRPGTGWVRQTVYFDGIWTDNDPMLAGTGDAWVLIYQRAFLQEMGVRWSDPNQAQWANKYGAKYQQGDAALVAVTGAAVWHDGVNGLDRADLADLAAVAGKRATIVLTRDMDLGRYGLIENHAYTVLGVTTDATGTKVTLRNPWGSDGPMKQGPNDGIITVSWDVFRNIVQGFCVA